jgi:squalene synthase HpnC
VALSEAPAIAATSLPSAAAPAAVRTAFTRAADVAEAQAFTRKLAHEHYENFSVISLLLPQHQRQDFCNIYAFCRIADDLGDEIADSHDALTYLDRFRGELRAAYGGGGPITSGVFIALRETVTRYDIPIQPFLDLIDAFEQDQRVTRYDTYEQLLEYCRRSANPVGRLVLYLCGYRDEERQRLSDLTCTALQLANCWQDVRRDLRDLDRIYIPQSTMTQFGVSEDQIAAGRADDAFRAMIRFEVDRTDLLFDQGEQLLPLLSPAVRRHVALFGLGGRAVLAAIRKQDYDVLTRRPALSTWKKGCLVVRAMAGQLLGGFRRSAAL